MISHLVFLGLGANLGDRRQTLLQAYEEIEKLIGPLVGRSAFYVSEPWGFVSDNNFLNSVVCCQTSLLPREVLRATQQIERHLGRKKKSADGVYHDRPIDIDILLYDNLHVNEYDLCIPHPLMLQRDFVMRPLVEVMGQLKFFTPPCLHILTERASESS